MKRAGTNGRRYWLNDMIIFIDQMVETHKRKRKNTVITKIILILNNAEHIKQTLSTNKPYRHQQHLPKISRNVSEIEVTLLNSRNT